MTDEQRERILDRLLESQARHDTNLAESRAQFDAKLEESRAHHDATLRKLEELQMTDHIAITRLNSLLAAFAEQHHAAMLEFDNGLIRLEALIEAFIRGSRHNGGRRSPRKSS
jgi:hypothetical protein